MSRRKDKAYKEAVAKLTATVAALGNGSWQGVGSALPQPAPQAPQPPVKPRQGRR